MIEPTQFVAPWLAYWYYDQLIGAHDVFFYRNVTISAHDKVKTHVDDSCDTFFRWNVSEAIFLNSWELIGPNVKYDFEGNIHLFHPVPRCGHHFLQSSKRKRTKNVEKNGVMLKWTHVAAFQFFVTISVSFYKGFLLKRFWYYLAVQRFELFSTVSGVFFFPPVLAAWFIVYVLQQGVKIFVGRTWSLFLFVFFFHFLIGTLVVEIPIRV